MPGFKIDVFPLVYQRALGPCGFVFGMPLQRKKANV